MNVLNVEGVEILGICACLPKKSEDNLARCSDVYGDAKKAQSIVKATGIFSRRVVEPGTSSLDLCVRAAETLLAETGTAAEDIGAVIQVSFTPERTMPCNACQAQHRLGLPREIMAFDINLACSGWAYGLYVAGLLAKALGRKVLLLDGDTQTTHMDKADIATVPVMADAGSATLVQPNNGSSPWRFSFYTDGEKGNALSLPFGGTIQMDGLAVFKFVTMDVLRFIQAFMASNAVDPESLDAFVPHQANIFMIQQIAKKLKLAEKIRISGDALGNSSSATVPVTIAYTGARGRLLVSGFGGGLSASVGVVEIGERCVLKVVEM